MLVEYVKIAAQITIALSIYNVWFFRFNKPTRYRGKNAETMKDEFTSYGLPDYFVWLIGFLKVTLATLLLVGIYINSLVFPENIHPNITFKYPLLSTANWLILSIILFLYI